MELIKNVSQIENMRENKIIGKPQLVNSEINFRGKNNILFCADNIKLVDAKLNFKGNNSIVYLSVTKSEYNLNIVINNNSLIFLGKNIKLNSNFNIDLKEHQHVVIGEDCVIGSNVSIKTSDEYPIYDLASKQRINFSKTIFVGDHVGIGDSAYLSRGVKIGSGAIIDNKTYIPPNFVGFSNCFILGNPAQIMQNDVFFTPDFLESYTFEDTVNSSTYKSDVFIYDFVENETLDFNKIDEIISDLSVDQKLDFIQKLLIENKRKNRFTIR